MPTTSTRGRTGSVRKEARVSFTSIRKRDGRIADFDADKITRAILKAGRASGEFSEEIARKLTIRVLGLTQVMANSEVPTVEEIQDVVEDVLLTSPFKKTAKAYILYRDQHARIREMIKKADVDLIDNYLEKLDWQVQENSNMAYSLQGLNNYISSEVSKTYWLNKIYTAEVREAHSSGALHIHDLGLLSVYCVGWDLQDLLRSGFRGAAGKAESSPAKHLSTALGQIVNFFYTLQGEAAGAQAFSNFDTLLAPFIRYDGLSYKRGQAGPAGVRLQRERPHPGRVPDAVHKSHSRPPASLRPGEGTCHHRRKADEGDLRGIRRRDGDAQPRLPRGAVRRRRRGRVFTFPIPTYNIILRFRLGRPRPRAPLGSHRQVRDPLLRQLRQFRPLPRRRPVDVLPAAARHAGRSRRRAAACSAPTR